MKLQILNTQNALQISTISKSETTRLQIAGIESATAKKPQDHCMSVNPDTLADTITATAKEFHCIIQGVIIVIQGQAEAEVLQGEGIFEADIKAIVHPASVVHARALAILCGNVQQDFANHAVPKDMMHGALHAPNTND